MKLSFAGGTDAVGSLGMVVETQDNRLLFDYGLTPAKPPKYPRKVPPIDALFLTHSHLDHIGMSPYVCGEYRIDRLGIRGDPGGCSCSITGLDKDIQT